MHFGDKKISGSESEVTVAAIQMKVELGNKEVNLLKTADMAKKAVCSGAELLIFPELCNTGYIINNRAELAFLAEDIENGESIKFWKRLASDLNIHMVLGFIEKEGLKYFNTAVVLGPNGLLGVYRKLHLFDFEKLYFEPGDKGLPVFDLPFGKIGVLICYDLRFFEAGRILMLKGADLICVPTNWLVLFDRSGIDERGYSMQNYAGMMTANTNQVFIVCANRIGCERGSKIFGKSMIVEPSGWPSHGPASEDNEEILISKINLSEARIGKIRSDLNDIIRDRRTDIYDEMLGSHERRYPF